MFATLAGGYPRPDLPPDASRDAVVRALLSEQADAGLGILSDAGFRHADAIAAITGRLEGFEPGPDGRPRARHEPSWDGPILVADWQATAALTDLPVKQTLVGPFTLARSVDPGPLTRERLTMALADALAHELRALVAAGAPMIEVHEPAAAEVGASRSEGSLFKAAHRRLLNSVREAHLTLAVTGGDLSAIPPLTFYDAPYRSYLIDVVTVPMNWLLVMKAPAERGVIVGAADARTDERDDPAFLGWAAAYAASMLGRGAERVGLAPSGSLADRGRDAARAKIEALADVAAATHSQLADHPEGADILQLARDGLRHGWLPLLVDEAQIAANMPGAAPR